MPELLLELGTEELPASFVRKAYTDLKESLTTLLGEAGVLDGDGVAMGTPRRQIVAFAALLARQADTTKEQRGPALKAAYDADGNPTPALLGFCRSQGVDVTTLRRDEQYVWVTKEIPGRATADILAEILPKAIKGLSFDKSMRWGGSRMRFARPIRWILATFDGQVVPFEIEGVTSGNESRGHRFYSPEPFVVHGFDGLVSGLRERMVEPDPARRWDAIVTGANEVAIGTPVLSDALLEENTFLTEWPTAIQGTFRESFMNLPEPVLITAMAKHEKMFPVRDADGKLTNRFVFIRNSGEDATVREGCEWVLNARFNDAKFFFDEDAKLSLDDFLAKTETILFQERLGSVRRRADRLAKLARIVAEVTGADEHEAELAETAGQYAKADLATGLVSELSSLQGVIGGEYGRRAGLAEEVCVAIARQYEFGKNAAPVTAADRTAVRLSLADQLDKLAGYLGQGLAPSGSSDPFGLRRAATVLIESAWVWPGRMADYASLLEHAVRLYTDQGVDLSLDAAQGSLAELFSGRYDVLLGEVRHDVLNAARVGGTTAPQDLKFRTSALTAALSDATFIQAMTRPLNIVAAARKKGIEIGEGTPDLGQLDSAEGTALWQQFADALPKIVGATDAWHVEEALGALKSLVPAINAFFDATMVMVDQPEVRLARLTLLNGVASAALRVGDFSALEG